MAIKKSGTEIEQSQWMDFQFLLDELKQVGGTTSGYGTLFEMFCKKVLETAPFFADDIVKVWNWKDFPGNNAMHDTGIDLVALTKDGRYNAYQCKFYDPDGKVSKASVDSFISAATRSFVVDGTTYNYAEKFIFSTTKNISQNASGLFTTIDSDVLLDCGIDWSKFRLDDLETMQASPKKTPKEHQKTAIEAVLKGFETDNRGRLTMACGTGKTFTSLKIIEGLYQRWDQQHSNDATKNFNVLYLVPSIALLSQTIIEWKAQSGFKCNVITYGICSDATAGGDGKKPNAKAKAMAKKASDELTVLMPIPATTDVDKIIEDYNERNISFTHHKTNIFFSTYQSIDVVSDFCKKSGVVFDIAVCDEAHRTIGAYKEEGDDISNFVKIHDDKIVPCKQRLYMTATEKVYSSTAKQEAKDGGWNVYSMDDESIYGKQFYYLSFGEAVTKQLLTDYRLMVLNIRKSDIARLGLPISSSLDDASKIVGALSALSKIPSDAKPDEFAQDPKPMKRSVAFFSSIAKADAGAEAFNRLSNKNCMGLDYMADEGFVIPSAKLITGGDNSYDKDKKLKWLRDEIPDGECRILTNARCLSEGVDVPSLDSVIFMDRRQSQVDIIQAVGRVMRKFGSGSEKKYGYIIIPIVISDEKMTDIALSSSDEYKRVWQIVQALRSHDERLDVAINKIGVTGNLPSSICFIDAFVKPVSKNGTKIGSRKKENLEGGDVLIDVDPLYPWGDIAGIPSDEDLKASEAVFAAQLVKHCGNRLYWEDWSKNVGDVTTNISLKIKEQIKEDKTARSFNRFLANLRKLLNPSISEDDAVAMIAEHVVVLPVLKAIFNENNLIDENPVSQIMESMVKKLKNLSVETAELEPFYASVRKTVEGITSSEGRQEIIRKLFEKFFQYALPKSAEKFGIVYTPIEIVDFIVNSVSDVLESEFGQSIAERNVKVLDPFSGTGTFTVRLLEKLKELGISDEDLQYKYENDIWCNEIMLLAYYIGLVNIEDTYGRLKGDFKPFEHEVLTDTFELAEKKKTKFYQTAWFEEQEFKMANAKAKDENEACIKVIFGNPPYSVGQGDANKNNANTEYPYIDDRIFDTYIADTSKTFKASLYDNYVRAFRWSSDRIGDDGIVSFVSNGSYIDNLAFTGFRRALLKEFNHVYVYNLRGNQRTMGELSRKEGGKIFGSGSRNTICIIVLVKHKGEAFDDYVHYKDIGDYLSREEKLKIVADESSIKRMKWQQVFPDENNDWINKKVDYPSNARILGGKKTLEISVYSDKYSSGIKTNKDTWLYNCSTKNLATNCQTFIDTLSFEIDKNKSTPFVNFKDVSNYVAYDRTKIKWSDEILKLVFSKQNVVFDHKLIVTVVYRPFVKKKLYYDKNLINSIYRMPNMFDGMHNNLCIAVPGIGNTKSYSCIMTSQLLDLEIETHCQAFPLYWYNPLKPNLFKDDYAITTDYLEQTQKMYNDSLITKEDIFYYIYGLFHSPTYKEKYANNLKKELPHITYCKDFWGYVNIGRKLADLHLNYEAAKPYDGVVIKKKNDDYTVTKIRFLAKDRKDTLIYNDSITISSIPLEAYDYVVNGRSPIEWVMDQYQYSVDKDSGIVDDPNLYDEEKGGKYIFDLILSLITVSLETQKLVKELPEYKEI